MAVNDKISQQDYNDIQTIVQRVLGNGSSNFGYGQVVQSSPVSVRDSISIQEWSNLRLDLINIRKHQTGSVPSLPQPVENEIIKFDANNEPYNSYLIQAQLYDNDAERFKLGTNQFVTTNRSGPTFTSTWKNKLTCTVTMTFDSGENARHYFNSGGRIQFTSTRSGGTSSTSTSTIGPQNTSWTNLLQQTVSSPPTFGGALPATGVNPNNGQNYFRCRNAYNRWYTISASSPYGANNFDINVRTPNVSDNSNGTARIIQFLVEWEDDHTFTSVGPDGVDGTLTLDAVTLDPIFVMQPAGVNPIAIESPSITFSAITGS